MERLAAVGRVAAQIAHEVRNPLGGIELFAGIGSPDSTWNTVSVVMLAPMPSAMAITISAVSILLRFKLRSARSK